MRLFVAIPPPPDAVTHLTAAVNGVKAAASGLRWVAPQRWHVTLTFCGEVAEARLPDLTTWLARAAAGSRPLQLGFHGAGAFPRATRATVLWCGLSGDVARLRQLAAATSAAARRCGISVETRAFRPHVTVARCPRPTDLRPAVAALAPYDGPPWQAEEMQLVRSVTRSVTARGGPSYQTLRSWRLDG